MNHWVMFPEDTGNPPADNENRAINAMLSDWARTMTRTSPAPAGRRAKKAHYDSEELAWLLSFKDHLLDHSHRILAEAK